MKIPIDPERRRRSGSQWADRLPSRFPLAAKTHSLARFPITRNAATSRAFTHGWQAYSV